MTQPPASPQQSPYRCETCELGKKRLRILYPNGEEKTRLVKCEFLNRALTHEESDIISLVGCYSHSANTEARGRVEKVIQSINDQINALKNMEPEYGSWNWHVIQAHKEAIALLKDGVERK